MEFFYDEQATSNQQIGSNGTHDDKTEEVFNKLEGKIDAQYQRTTEALKSFVSDEGDIELKLPINSHLTDQAQDALKKFDDQLHNVESLAQGYWSKVSEKSFWSSMTDSLGSQFEKVLTLKADENAESQEKSIRSAAANRTDAELRQLSSNEDLYLNYKNDIPEGFVVDKLTSEIAKLLEEDESLRRLMNAIVPEKISYQNFWAIYFSMKEKIITKENLRKEILEKNVETEEEIGWDDDEDESGSTAQEIPNKETPSEETLRKETPSKETGVAVKDAPQTKENESKDVGKRVEKNSDEVDDEDDDWE